MSDIIVDDARHLVFSTPQQKNILQNSKTWYCDATFKAVKSPFTQLFSIHAFVKGEGDTHIKQVPLAFALMSRRRKNDYTQVLNAIIDSLRTVSVKNAVLDFESAMWRAIKSVLPDIRIKGCCFHWRQAVWRKADSLGLRVPYLTSDVINSFIRELLALPYIPEEHIRVCFEKLEERARVAAPAIQELISYTRATWIDSSLWSPGTWSVFNRSVRTNNDTEGWHRRLNSRTRPNQHLYTLINTIYKEAQLVSLQVRMVKDRKLKKYQRIAFKNMQGRLFRLWEKYEKQEIKTSELLSACSHLSRPHLH